MSEDSLNSPPLFVLCDKADHMPFDDDLTSDDDEESYDWSADTDLTLQKLEDNLQFIRDLWDSEDELGRDSLTAVIHMQILKIDAARKAKTRRATEAFAFRDPEVEAAEATLQAREHDQAAAAQKCFGDAMELYNAPAEAALQAQAPWMHLVQCEKDAKRVAAPNKLQHSQAQVASAALGTPLRHLRSCAPEPRL